MRYSVVILKVLDVLGVYIVRISGVCEFRYCLVVRVPRLPLGRTKNPNPVFLSLQKISFGVDMYDMSLEHWHNRKNVTL